MNFITEVFNRFGQHHQEVSPVWIPPNRVLNSPTGLEKMAADHCYFSIRLSEMFLENRQEYWQHFLPMAIAQCEFIYGPKRRSVPVYIGSNLLLPEAQALEVDYVNTTLLGPVPYRGGELCLFLGLFKVPAEDATCGVLSFAENLVKEFKITPLCQYLEAAKTIKTGLSALLGMNTIQMRLGRRSVFTGTEGGINSLKPGFLVYLRGNLSPEEEASLWVEKDKLYKKDQRNHLSKYNSSDYCLIKLSAFKKRDDYALLGFEQGFNQVLEQIDNLQEEVAIFFLKSLLKNIRESPDLTPEHRENLIRLYLINYEKSWELALTLNKKKAQKPDLFRGGLGKLNAKDVVEHMSYVSNVEGKMSAQMALRGLAEHLDEITARSAPFQTLTTPELNRQMALLENLAPAKNVQLNELTEFIQIFYRREHTPSDS